jgi:hypothetical protein
MRIPNTSSNVASPWASIFVVVILTHSQSPACNASREPGKPAAASLRATAVASKHDTLKQPAAPRHLLWHRPSFERPALVNGSIALQALNMSGRDHCNSVCGSMMDFALIADVSASVGQAGVQNTQVFLARLLNRLRLGQGKGQQLAGLIEAGMKSRLLAGLTDEVPKFVDGINKLSFRGRHDGGALDLVEAMGMAHSSFMHGRQDARSLVIAIVDGPALRQRLTVQMAERISQSADLVVILVADRFKQVAQRDAMEWLKAAGSCTPYGCRLLQISDYESLATVDTTGVLAEICPNLV